MTQVYFLKPADADGPIKIGSSTTPLSRLRTYQIWSPVVLELVTSCAAHRNTERFLHRHFLADYLHGEWFHMSPELADLIAHIIKHQAMPEWVCEGTPTNPREFGQFIAKYPQGKPRRIAA